MSLSKPVVGVRFDKPSPAAPQYSVPRGIQLGIAIGLPIAVVAALGVCWWRGVFSSSKPNTKKPIQVTETESPRKSDIADGKTGNVGQKDDSRPSYVRLKDEGNAYFKKGDYVQALELYESAIKETPPPSELAALYQNRAAVFEKLGDWVQVINESSAALKLNPKYVKALSRRCKAYRQTGFIEEALEDITAVCVLESFSVPSNIQTADDILKEIGQSEAERLMKDKKPTQPSDHSIRAFLRAFHCDPVTKWWHETSDEVEHAINGNSSKLADDPNLGGFPAVLHALKYRQYGNILDLCTQEIESGGPYVDEAYLVRGTFRHLWGYQDEVYQDFMKVVESSTASKELKASAYIKLGAQTAMQPDANFEQYFQKAEELWSENVDVYHQRGQILLTKGDYELAVVQINKANEVAPDFALAAASKWYVEYRIANMTHSESGVSNALKNFNKCMRKFEKSPDVFNLYGQILMELGQYQEAVQQFDHVIKLDPTNAAIYVHKAVAKYQLEGKVDKVLPLLYNSLSIDDKNEFVYETIGTLELQAGNLEKASYAISQAINLAKTSQELMMLSALLKAAEVQHKVKIKYNMDVPPPTSYGNPGY